jgi:hypothetical protein
MAYNNPPWTPNMDQEAVEFYNKLEAEKYDGHVDDIGNVRWSSEWRMHRGNGMNPLDATVAVFKSIDAIRAGQPPPQNPPGPYDVPWSPELDQECTPFCDNLRKLYQDYQEREVDETGWVRWSSDYRIHRANGLSPLAAWQKIEYEILDIWNVLPEAGEAPTPIIGQLLRRGNLFAHEHGLITPQFSSDFVLLRTYKTDRDMYERVKSDLVRYRYQGSRLFTNVGGWAGFWDDAEVVFTTYRKWQFSRESGHLRPATDPSGQPLYGPVMHAWDDADSILFNVCQDFMRSRLCIHFTTGDSQIIHSEIGSNGQPHYVFEKELEHHRRVARIIKSVNKQVAALYEVRNEYPMNSPYGGNEQDRRNMGVIIKEVKNILGTDVLCGLGAGLSEEPEVLLQSSEYSDVCFQHTSRVPFDLCLKRTLALRYWEGQWGAFPFPFVNGEPKPMNIPPFGDGVGDDGYAPTDRVDQLIALHTMIALTSQAGNVFTGASVKLKTYPSYMPGYKEIPLIIEEHIPEAAAVAQRETAGRGAILYFTVGNKFATSTDEHWDTTPPRPVASWTMYTGNEQNMEILQGTGNPPQGRTGFIVGTFA